jgi:transposase InsO family protein
MCTVPKPYPRESGEDVTRVARNRGPGVADQGHGGDFCSVADVAGLQVSFGSTGDCWDNAAMETFSSTLKREITRIRGSIWFDTCHDARLYLFEFIEDFYNRQRHQALLGHRTPVEFAATFDP